MAQHLNSFVDPTENPARLLGVPIHTHLDKIYRLLFAGFIPCALGRRRGGVRRGGRWCVVEPRERGVGCGGGDGGCGGKDGRGGGWTFGGWGREGVIVREKDEDLHVCGCGEHYTVLPRHFVI